MELRTERLRLIDILPNKAATFADRLGKRPDDIEFIRKGIPIEPDSIEVKEGERSAIRFITTPRLDRDGEILIPGGAMLDDFRQSPSVLYAHDYKALPIGKDLWIKPTKAGILAKTQYADHDFAEDVFQCVKGGFLNSNSVGFVPVEKIEQGDSRNFSRAQDILKEEYGVDYEESGKAKNIYTQWILLEHSDVPVASNPQALNVMVAKGLLNINGRLKRDLGFGTLQAARSGKTKMTREQFDLFIKKKVEEAIRRIDMEDVIKTAVEDRLDYLRGKVR